MILQVSSLGWAVLIAVTELQVSVVLLILALSHLCGSGLDYWADSSLFYAVSSHRRLAWTWSQGRGQGPNRAYRTKQGL